MYVGREDGLFQYSRSANKFLDLQPEANLFPDDSNFKSAQGRSGAIFAGGGDQAFFRIDVGNFVGGTTGGTSTAMSAGKFLIRVTGFLTPDDV